MRLSPGAVVRWCVGMSGGSWTGSGDPEETEVREWGLVLWYDSRPTQGRTLGTAAVLRRSGRVEVVPRTWLP
jgi:hypothetical protein